jgi:murein DD-endopeptidase MepM/ murein hydrolase activator NlpD
LDELQGEFVRAQTKLAIANGQVSDARTELRARAVSAYVDNPKTHAADVMLRANSLRQLAATMSYFKAVVAVQRSALDRLSARRDDVEALRQSLEQTKDQARQQRDVVFSREAVLESARAQQAGLRSEVQAEERQQQSLLDEVQARKAEFEAQIASLRAESDSISGLLRGVQAGQGVAPSGHGVLGVPIPGALVTSPFGPRMHPVFHVMRMHTGVDFGAGAGTPIKASADGVVVAAGPHGGYGNATIVDHGRSMATLYAHQSSIAVSPGDQVRRGQVIGYVGCTGYCTGPHLHFEVRVNGNPVDPMPYL